MPPIVPSISALVVFFMSILISSSMEPRRTFSTNDDLGIQTIRYYNPQTPLIPHSEFVIVQELFKKNNRSLSNLQVYRLKKSFGYHVSCNQFYKGLQLFTKDVIVHFDSTGKSSGLSGDFISSVAIDTVFKVPMKDAGLLFFKQLISDPLYRDSDSSSQNVSINAELRIYNRNAGSGNTPKKFVLVWKTTLANGGDVPIVYIRADSIQLISYDNGIRY